MDVLVQDLEEDRSVESALEITVAAESKVEKELEALMEMVVVSARDRVSKLDLLAEKASGIKSHANELQEVVSGAARKAERVAKRVRVLDASFQRCESALQRVEDILALRTCVEGVRSALEASDLETACGHVAKYLSLGEAARAEFSAESGSFASVSQVNESVADLTAAIRAKANKAAQGDSVQDVVAAVRLFVPIGLADEGLERFATYLQGAIHRESQKDVNDLLLEKTQTVEEEPHVVCLTSLFETVAGYLDECEKAIVDNFGPLALVQIARRLQLQCDIEATSILERYTQERRLDEYSRLITHRSADARALDNLLDEQAVVSQRAMRYFAFLTSRIVSSLRSQKGGQLVSLGSATTTLGASSSSAADETNGTGEGLDGKMHRLQVGMGGRRGSMATPRTPKPEKLEPDDLELAQHEFATFLRECGLQRAVEELTMRYISMEAYFMQENVLKAIRIDEAPPMGSSSTVSTAVDDVFFVLQKCVRRAVAYASLVTLCAVINYVNLSIGGELLDFVRRRLSDTEKMLDRLSSNTAAPLRGLTLTEGNTKHGEDGKSPYGFTVALNNAQLSSAFSLRLRSEVENTANEAFSAPRDHAQINAVLAQLSESSRALAAAAEDGLDHLANLLTGRLREAVEAMAAVSYLLEEAEYQDQARVERFMRTFISCLEKQALADLEDYLTESNWDGWVRRLAEWSAKNVEQTLVGTSTSGGGGIPPKSFNALGALQLSRDVRSLSTFFASKSRRGTVRDLFARLTQISVLVNLEKPSEVYDLWGPNAGGMTWRLTPSDVRKALALRVDFRADAIRSLRL